MSSFSKFKLLVVFIFLSQLVSGVSLAEETKKSIKVSMGHRLTKPDKGKNWIIAKVTIEELKAQINFQDGTIKTIRVPSLIQSLNVDDQKSFIVTVLDGYADLIAGVVDRRSYVISILDQLRNSGFLVDEVDLSLVELAAESLIESALYVDIGSMYIDVTMEMNAMMEDFYNAVDSMIMGYDGYGASEWDNWESGGYTPDVNDTSSTSGTVYYSDGSSVTYYEDANGVRTYTHTSADGTTTTSDNDQDNNGYPDYNNDGGWDNPFTNNITPQSEGSVGRGRRFPFSMSPYATFVTWVQIEFYNLNNVQIMENMLLNNVINKVQYQTMMNAAFSKFLVSDTLKNLRASYERATGLKPPSIILNSVRFE